jgi:hypothetical protein
MLIRTSNIININHFQNLYTISPTSVEITFWSNDALNPKKLRTSTPEEERTGKYTRVYPKVSGLAVGSENCKWYSSLLLGTVVSLFCESVE